MTTNIERAAAILADWADSEGGLTAIDNDYGGDMTGAAEALADAGLLMPDMQGKPDTWGEWDVGGLEVSAVDNDGEVRIEWEDEPDYAYYGPQTRTLWLNREQVIAILTAANHAEQEQDNV